MSRAKGKKEIQKFNKQKKNKNKIKGKRDENYLERGNFEDENKDRNRKGEERKRRR